MDSDDFEKRKTIRFQRPVIKEDSTDTESEDDEQTGEFLPGSGAPDPEPTDFEKRKTGTFQRFDPDSDPE